jgi:DNA-binding transcriptional LysR family regulator
MPKKPHTTPPLRHLKGIAEVVEIARLGSIRRAAESLNLTASAMNRKLQDLEAEVETPLFERRARGVRLTTAGEAFVRYARSQLVEAEALRSQIEDLKGLRVGPVRIACSQAVAYDFLPQRIAEFRRERPRATFSLAVLDHDRALQALATYEAELALAFRPAVWPTIRVVARLPQRLVAIMRADHPLAAGPSLRLSACLAHGLALPDRSFGGRQLLDEAAARRDLQVNIVAESNSFEMLRALALRSGLVTFQIEIGAPAADLTPGLVGVPLDERDMPLSDLALCQLRGRPLPAMAAAFAERLAESLARARPVG